MGGKSELPRTKIEVIDGTFEAKTFNYLVKCSIIVLFVVALVFPIDHLEGKAMGIRAPLFIGSAILIPVLERVRRVRCVPYPHTADSFLVVPFVIDTFGNVIGLYENFSATDDVFHCINWIFLVCAFQAFHFRRSIEKQNAILLGAGFGALAIVGWEIIEWIVDTTGAGGGLGLTYGDTIGDLTLSTSGGIIGSCLGVFFFGVRNPSSSKESI
jgi:hypothetical protein